MSKNQYLKLKIILVGDSSVGKSSILLKYDSNTFLDIYNATIGMDFIYKDVQVDGIKIKLQVMDTAGQEKYRSMIPSYFKGVDGIFLVFDLSQRSSFDSLDNWIKIIGNYFNITPNNLILLGNKSDLSEIRAVDKEEIDTFKDKNKNIEYREISTKNKEEVDSVFEDLVKLILKDKPELNSIKGSKLNNQTTRKKKFC